MAAVARTADPDPWRHQLRETLGKPKSEERSAALRQPASSARPDELPETSLDLLGQALLAGEEKMAETVLRQGQRHYPGDVGLNYDLARELPGEGGAA